MKKIFTFLLSIVSFVTINAQAVGDFGSVATGTWAAVGTWKQWDGSGWNTTPAAAPTGSESIYINNTVTIPASTTVTLTGTIRVNTGGSLAITGTSAILAVSTGTLIMNGGSVPITSSGALNFTGTSFLRRENTAGTFTNTTPTVPTGGLLTYTVNVTYSPSGNTDLPTTGGNRTNLVVSSGVTYTMATTVRTIRDLTINGTLAVGTGGLNVENNISGTGTCSAGTITLSAGSGNRTIAGVTFNNLTLNHNGNYAISNNTTVNGVLNFSTYTPGTTGTPSPRYLNLQTFTLTAGSITGGNPFTYAYGTTGKLATTVQAGIATTFPIANTTSAAAAANVYSPVTVKPTNTATFTVTVPTATAQTGQNASTKVMPRTWDISATGAGDTELTFVFPTKTIVTTNGTPVTYNTSGVTAANTPTSSSDAVFGHKPTGSSTWTERLVTYTTSDVSLSNGGGTVTVAITQSSWKETQSAASGFSPFGTGVLTGFNAVLLPIELISFTATKKDTKTLLKWATASESNNAYFTVERSANGKDFVTLGEEKGAGDSQRRMDYSFTDEKPLSGINYYRLKQTDYDGRYTYSKIQSLKFDAKNQTVITPTATQGTLNISTDMDDYSTVIYNLAGQEVKRMSNMSLGQIINIDELNNGVYLVKIINSNNEVLTQKITKF
jgi:Secretion system C-terminal sorting domain